MYSTKSFCNVTAFASQEPGVVSAIGELTTYAKTFTKDLGFYRHSTIERYELMNFSSKTDGVANIMPQTNVDQAIAFVDLVTRATLMTSGELYYDETLAQLMTKAEQINATNVKIGAMVNSGDWWVPQWISWTEGSDSAANTHKVWLSLPAFVNQYTDYEIVVVPPIVGLDQFFNPGGIVENLIKAITTSQIMERAELAKQGFPETVIRSDPYEYCDPITVSRKIDVEWTVLIYGAAGNDPDIIRDALVNYILDNSTHSRDDWAVIFPDIFKRTEFVFAPYWSNFAVEQRVFDQGIYSPIVNNQLPVSWLTLQAFGYTNAHIQSVSQTLAFPYRSMQMGVVGHFENRDGKVRITDHYPDFINVGTETTDFARMNPITQAWAIAMMELVIMAESITTSTDLPQGMHRVIRGTKTYVAKTYNRVLLLVLAKSSI